MKKKTKKKLAKFGKKVGKGVLKGIFVYPAKGAWSLIKKGAETTKEKHEKRVINKIKPVVEAQYDSFKEVKNHQGKLTTFTNKLHNNKSTIGLILGARGTGKSAIGMRLLENFKAKTKKNIYALGFKEESLPSWISVVNSIEEIQNNAVILIDEGGIEFSSRKSMSNANKFLSELLLIARHKDLSVIFITQNSSNLEINAIRQADYLVMKPSSLLQKDFERKKIKDIYRSVQEDFDQLIEDKSVTYIYGNDYLGFISNSLPSFWSEKVSKGYAKR
tara:strand:+ start:3320 stop:4144 length:825 start_codon:yes stop_codon:yes gene_type:complete